MTYFRYLLGGVGRQKHQCPGCGTTLRVGGPFRLPAVCAAAVGLYFLVPAAGGRIFPDREIPFSVAAVLIVCLIALLAAANYLSATWRADKRAGSRDR